MSESYSKDAVLLDGNDHDISPQQRPLVVQNRVHLPSDDFLVVAATNEDGARSISIMLSVGQSGLHTEFTAYGARQLARKLDAMCDRIEAHAAELATAAIEAARNRKPQP